MAPAAAPRARRLARRGRLFRHRGLPRLDDRHGDRGRLGRALRADPRVAGRAAAVRCGLAARGQRRAPRACSLGALLIGLGYGPATPASSVILARAAPPAHARAHLLDQADRRAAGHRDRRRAWCRRWCCGSAGRARRSRSARPARSSRSPLAPLREQLRPRAQSARRRCRCARRSRRWRWCCATAGCSSFRCVSFVYGGVQITLVAYLVTFLVESFALSLVLAGMVMAASQLTSVAGAHRSGACSPTASRPRAPRSACSASAWALPRCARSRRGPRLAAVAAVRLCHGVRRHRGRLERRVSRRDRAPRAARAASATPPAARAFFTFLGVVVTPPLFHLVLHLTSSYGVTYALFGLPALAAGARLLLTARIARDERHS